MAESRSIGRRTFHAAFAAGIASSLVPFRIGRAQARALKVGVILPRSGYLGLTS